MRAPKENARMAVGLDAGESANRTIEVNDPAAIRHGPIKFAECVFDPADIIELRTLSPARSRWCMAGKLPALVETLAKANRRDAHIYIGANPRVCHGDGTKAQDCTGGQCGKCGRCVAWVE